MIAFKFVIFVDIFALRLFHMLVLLPVQIPFDYDICIFLLYVWWFLFKQSRLLVPSRLKGFVYIKSTIQFDYDFCIFYFVYDGLHKMQVESGAGF